MKKPIKVNKKCIVRSRDCKRIFQGSWMCFVACPNSDEIGLELDILQQKLREFGIEPYIAIDQKKYQMDIFCEKICTKIIEAQFCIVILNDVIDKQDNVRKSNANVYYEYGLMTAFRKKIIPIQIMDHKLAFNIQSLDTLKYRRDNFSSLIEEAIRSIKLIIEEEQQTHYKQKDELHNEIVLDLLKLVRLDSGTKSHYESILSIGSLGFQPYIHSIDNRLCLVGFFSDDETNDDLNFKCKMMTLRVKNYCDQMKNEVQELQKNVDNSSKTILKDKINNLEEGYNYFSSATIIIVKDNLMDKDLFLDTYKQSITDDFSLILQIVNEEVAEKLLGNIALPEYALYSIEEFQR